MRSQNKIYYVWENNDLVVGHWLSPGGSFWKPYLQKFLKVLGLDFLHKLFIKDREIPGENFISITTVHQKDILIFYSFYIFPYNWQSGEYEVFSMLYSVACLNISAYCSSFETSLFSSCTTVKVFSKNLLSCAIYFSINIKLIKFFSQSEKYLQWLPPEWDLGFSEKTTSSLFSFFSGSLWYEWKK